MASLQERVNNRKFYKRVRRNGKWVTIDTRTNKIVDKATRIKHKTKRNGFREERTEKKTLRTGLKRMSLTDCLIAMKTILIIQLKEGN